MVTFVQAGFQTEFLRSKISRHQVENPTVNLNTLNDTEYNSLTEIISKLEREEKLLMMSVDERETFFKNEIEELKAQEKAALEAAKQSDHPLPTVKEETQLESQPETDTGDVVSNEVDGDATPSSEVLQEVTEVDEGNIDDQLESHGEINAEGDTVEGSQIDNEKVDEETTEKVDEEKALDIN